MSLLSPVMGNRLVIKSQDSDDKSNQLLYMTVEGDASSAQTVLNIINSAVGKLSRYNRWRNTPYADKVIDHKVDCYTRFLRLENEAGRQYLDKTKTYYALFVGDTKRIRNALKNRHIFSEYEVFGSMAWIQSQNVLSKTSIGVSMKYDSPDSVFLCVDQDVVTVVSPHKWLIDSLERGIKRHNVAICSGDRRVSGMVGITFVNLAYAYGGY